MTPMRTEASMLNPPVSGQLVMSAIANITMAVPIPASASPSVRPLPAVRRPRRPDVLEPADALEV